MIMEPSAIQHFELDGGNLTLEEFVAAARFGARAELSDWSLDLMEKSRAFAERIAYEKRVAYGITTGFGDFQKVAVPDEMSSELATNLILSHCTCMGEPFAEDAVRGQRGQMTVASNLRKLTEGSEILDRCQNDRVQGAYSLRCIPQYHGAVRDALGYVRTAVDTELNAVTDNPLLFIDDESVISGGNFRVEPMAIPFDTLGIACAEPANISERRMTAALSNGLTPFLTTKGGVNSGFMIVRYAADSMVSENKVSAHPASVDSIPSSANHEDIVSMGTTAARKAAMIVQKTLSVLADELLTACQTIDIRRRLNTHGTRLTPLHEAIFSFVRDSIDFYETDREIWPDIAEENRLIRSGKLPEITRNFIPDLE